MTDSNLSAADLKALHDAGVQSVEGLMKSAAKQARDDGRFFPNGITRLRFESSVTVSANVQFSLEVEVEGPPTSTRVRGRGWDVGAFQLTPNAIYDLEVNPGGTLLHVVTIDAGDGYSYQGVSWADASEYWFVHNSVSDLAATLQAANAIEMTVSYDPSDPDEAFKALAQSIHASSHKPLRSKLFPTGSDWAAAPAGITGADYVFGVMNGQYVDTTRPCYAFRADPNDAKNLGRLVAMAADVPPSWTGSSYALTRIANSVVSNLKHYDVTR
ncbi:MAG: hypothetical protein AB7S26_34595 [Sandaracinaceae bacterium]